MTEGATRPDAQDVLEANIAVHTAMAPDYERTQPHYRPENVARVTEILRALAAETGGENLLDLGCGTGFILEIAKQFFERVVGVDITPAMLERVDLSSGNVEVLLGRTEELPFDDASFDVCTAYSYLHHLPDLRPSLTEAARCLRPGGKFFADQDPNRAFWRLADALAREGVPLNGIVAREVHAVTHTAEDMAAGAGVTAKEVALAEYRKVYLHGLDPDEIVKTFGECGFSNVSVRYEWFLGQGKILHEQSEADSAVVEAYLREALPATRHLFKYIAFIATK